MTHIDRRRLLRLMAAAGVAGAAGPVLSACSGSSGSAAATKPIKIGAIVPQSGIYKSIGDDMTNGFELYLNLNGRTLGGHPAQIAYADEGDTVASGKGATNSLLVEQHVAAITGVASSQTMLAIRDMVEKAEIPLVGSNASPTTLQGVKYIWRTSYVNNEAGVAVGQYVSRAVAGPFFLIAADYTAGHDEVNGFLSAYGSSNIVGEPVFTNLLNTSDFTPYLRQIKRSNARAVYCFYAGDQARLFVQQYHNFGVGLPLYAPGFLTEGAGLLKQEGDAAKGIYTALNYSPDLDNEANQTFATAYVKAYDALPTTYAMASYDAAAVLDKAFARVGPGATSQALNAAIAQVGLVDSPRGQWQFNQSRTPQQKWYLRRVIRDGTVLSNVMLTELTTLG